MSAPERFTDGSEQEQRSSVKLVRNASGVTQIEVKCYGDDLAAAKAEAMLVYDSLCTKYAAPAKAGAR